MPFFCRWLVLQLLSVTPSQLLHEMHVQHDNACNSILKLTAAKTWHRYIFWNGICTPRIRSWALWFDRPVVHMYKKIANCSLADKCLECCKLTSLFNSSNNFSKTCLFSPNTALNLSPCPSSRSWTHCGQESLESLRGVLMYRPDSEWTTAPAAMQVTEPITCSCVYM